jgi:hypothetical protein
MMIRGGPIACSIGEASARPDRAAVAGEQVEGATALAAADILPSLAAAARQLLPGLVRAAISPIPANVACTDLLPFEMVIEQIPDEASAEQSEASVSTEDSWLLARSRPIGFFN